MSFDFNDPRTRARLLHTPVGRKALEHAAAAVIVPAKGARRHHRRAAQRLAARVLGGAA